MNRDDVLVIDANGSRRMARDSLPVSLREIVAKVESAAEVRTGRHKRVITESELRSKLLLAAQNRADSYRVERDESDLLDHDGAMATHALYSMLLDRSVEDTEADIYARAAVLGLECANAIEETREAGEFDLTNEEDSQACVQFASARIAYSGHIAAAWARDGFRTYDVTRGLYDLASLTDCDPNAAAAAPSAGWKVPAFALRFPGPDYPRVRDLVQGMYEIRGALVSQFRAAPSQATHAIMRENMLAVTEGLSDDETGHDERFGDLVNAIAPAAEAGLVGDSHGLALSFCGYNLTAKRPVGSTLENGFLRANTYVETTVAMAIRAWAQRAATDSGFPEENEPAYRHLLNVIFGVGLWITHSGDEGVPRRARPVRIFGTKRTFTPRAFVLGRGVKEAL